MGNANITPEILTAFRELVFKKYGKLYGALLKETDIAIQNRSKKLEIEISKKEDSP